MELFLPNMSSICASCKLEGVEHGDSSLDHKRTLAPDSVHGVASRGGGYMERMACMVSP